MRPPVSHMISAPADDTENTRLYHRLKHHMEQP
jgi:hypothetical protein